MRTNKLDVAIRAAAGAFLVSALLTGCGKQAQAPDSAAPETPSQAAPAIPDAPPPAESLPAPDAAPAAPVQPAPDAPAPTEPSAAPKPTASVPNLDSMNIATPGAKMSIAVDLRYQFDGAALPNQPVMLHLAAVPRVPGSRLTVTVKQVDGVQLAAGAPSLQKSNGAEVYRQQYSVTRAAASPAQLRVLVTMDYDSGSGFGFFSVPLDSGTNAQKQQSVKQR